VLLPDDTSGSSCADAAAAAAAVKSGAAESPVLPIVPFEACLNKFTAAEVRCMCSHVVTCSVYAMLITWAAHCAC
jgi:hypothetical protein